jgi:hypothetical protein
VNPLPQGHPMTTALYSPLAGAVQSRELQSLFSSNIRIDHACISLTLRDLGSIQTADRRSNGFGTPTSHSDSDSDSDSPTRLPWNHRTCHVTAGGDNQVVLEVVQRACGTRRLSIPSCQQSRTGCEIL